MGILFPARRGAGKSAKRHKENHVSNQSVTQALRKALVEVCRLTREQAGLFSGHSLRVGGSNYMRKLGIDAETHRVVGDWASLTSVGNYYALSAAEQFDTVDRFTLRDPPMREGQGGMTARQESR